MVAVKHELAKMDSDLQPMAFLQHAERLTGFILGTKNDEYIFAHRTFQEYPASVVVHEDRTGSRRQALMNEIGDDWWRKRSVCKQPRQT